MNKKISIALLIESEPKKGLELVFTRYAEKLYSYSMTNWSFSEDEAWDLVYKTLEKIIDSVKTYEFVSEKHFENFLYKIFKNNLREQYRKHKNFEKHIEFVPLEESLEVSANKEVESANMFFKSLINEVSDDDVNPKLQLLTNALKQLAPLDRELLLLRGQNFSYNEIAQFLRIENNQLKVKFHRAKKKLIQVISNLQKEQDG